MFQRKRFKHRSRHRGHQRHSNGNGHIRIRSDLYSNGQRKNNLRPTQSAEKLFEKYTALAKEAMSSGDKTLSENYLQHADHFMRIIDDRNKSRAENKTEDNISKDSKNLSDNTETENKNLKEKKDQSI